MFLGTHTPRLDEKGRIFLPAKFRDELSEGLVVTRGQERCLYVWPSAEFRSFTDELRKAPVTNKSARDFMRMLFAGASSETADKQGRITLPPMLRDYAGLNRDCIVIGAVQPRGDLGRRRVEHLQRRARAGVRRLVRGGASRLLGASDRPARTARTVDSSAASYDEVSGPPLALLAHLPRCQTGRGAVGDLGVRNGKHPASQAPPQHPRAHQAPTNAHQSSSDSTNEGSSDDELGMG